MIRSRMRRWARRWLQELQWRQKPAPAGWKGWWQRQLVALLRRLLRFLLWLLEDEPKT